uniref:Uncharacterized protein n=1 Tax=Meloidogyne incognita TaxID=6306 RepID=A0A914MTF4_MELIC
MLCECSGNILPRSSRVNAQLAVYMSAKKIRSFRSFSLTFFALEDEYPDFNQTIYQLILQLVQLYL